MARNLLLFSDVRGSCLQGAMLRLECCMLMVCQAVACNMVPCTMAHVLHVVSGGVRFRQEGGRRPWRAWRPVLGQARKLHKHEWLAG